MIAKTIAALALLLLAPNAQAQSSWPNKPVKILVPTAPGGTADNLARLYGLHMSKVTGQQFHVENRGGAGDVLGIESVVR
jgi:tripartite-type tricarboxylate transporter receptor subunit TctC